MDTPDSLKTLVRETYTEIVTKNGSCCGPLCGCGPDVTDLAIMADDYTRLPGYVADADLGLGCGLPTEYAHLQTGDVVLDLGSGAGNDAFVAAHLVGPTGRVIGVDMTPAMLDRARRNAAQIGAANVEFRLGEIEALPVADASVDVVVSNCVLNLVPDKARAFAEMQRVLKPGGHFCVSDIVTEGDLPSALRRVAELYAGCVGGAIERADYLAGLEAAGFTNVRVVKDKLIDLPDDLLAPYLTPDEIAAIRATDASIHSITVYGDRR